MSLLDLCSYLGLGAVGAITINMALGIAIALRYSPVRFWPHRRIDIFALHRWTAYVAMALILAHPAVLFFLPRHRFSLVQVLWPIHSYLQPKLNLAGAGALYFISVVLLSSLLRLRIPRALWRNLHWLVYPATALMLLHSLLTDPELRDGRPDMLDGGKVYIEATILFVVLAIVVRVALRRKGPRYGSTAPARSSLPG